MPNTHTNPSGKPVASDEVAQLREENARLREQLAQAQANQKAVPNTRPTPMEPSFGISEGVRADLEQTGQTVSPFTGKTLTKDDLKTDDVRVRTNAPDRAPK